MGSARLYIPQPILPKGEGEQLRTYAANFLNAVYSVEIPPTPLDKGGGDSRGDLQRH